MQNKAWKGGFSLELLHLTADLDRNIAALQALFAGDGTLVVRRIRAAGGLRCAVFFFDGMVDTLTINQSVVRPLLAVPARTLTAEHLRDAVLQVNDCRLEPDPARMLSALLYGDSVVLTDGDARPVVVNSKGFRVRAGAEPDNERVLRGPREGFTEAFMLNLSMLRRRINDPRLTFRFARYAGHTQTAVCLCWIKGVTDPALVHALSRRLDRMTLDGILDANYIAECIQDAPRSPFPLLGTTERPDVAAARLLEGRVAIVVDGSPVVLTAPCILQECFQANDDYYIAVRQAALARVLRMAGFVLSVLIPGLYIALLHFHPELLPTRLLLAISAARTGMPLPPFWEILVLLIVFEVLKEAGARTPGVMGSTMSIVGGLVLGQAAVSARFLSAPAVIIVAAAAVTALTVPKLQSAGMVLRFGLLAAAALAGLYGLAFGLALTLGHLCTLQSVGTPYLLNLVSRVHPRREDAFTRASWRTMRRRRFLAREEGEP